MRMKMYRMRRMSMYMVMKKPMAMKKKGINQPTIKRVRQKVDDFFSSGVRF